MQVISVQDEEGFGRTASFRSSYSYNASRIGVNFTAERLFTVLIFLDG